MRDLWRGWLEEWRFARRCLPWPVQALFLAVSAAFGLGLGLALAFAVAVALATLGGCTGHGRVQVGLSFFDFPVATVVEVEHADAETVRAGARLSSDPGVSVRLLGGEDGEGGGAGGLARYIVVLQRQNRETEAQARLGLDQIIGKLMEKKRNGYDREAQRETDIRRQNPGEGEASSGAGGKPLFLLIN